MNIYERINELCKINQINGIKLGEILGLKKSPLTDWKNEKSKPTLEQIEKMCEIFATTADYLIFGKNNLNENDKELLEYFHRLPEREQIKEIGKMEEKAEKFSNSEKSSDCRTG